MDPAGSETRHVNTISTREPGDLPLTICQCRRWPAPGRRGSAGDVRRGEVGPAHSSGEAGEQPERSGVSGAKERAMGTRNSHTCAGHRAGKACHRGCHAVEAAKQRKKERFISIVPPADSRSTGSRIPPLSRKAAAGVDGIRWMDYAGNMKNNITDLHRRLHQGQLQGAARQASLHPKSGWKTTPARHRLAGGQRSSSMRW